MTGANENRKYIVVVPDPSGRRAYLGPYSNFERARKLQQQINEQIDKYDRRGFILVRNCWASVEALEGIPRFHEIVEWAVGHPVQEKDE